MNQRKAKILWDSFCENMAAAGWTLIDRENGNPHDGPGEERPIVFTKGTRITYYPDTGWVRRDVQWGQTLHWEDFAQTGKVPMVEEEK